MPSVTFCSARLHGSASVPPSKSEAQHALLLAALGEGECRLRGFVPPLCEDIQVMLRGIAALGAEVEIQGDAWMIQPARPPAQGSDVAELHVGACAAALCMLIPVFWVRGQAVRITMEDGLFAFFSDAVALLAERVRAEMLVYPAKMDKPACIELRGKLNAGGYEVNGALPDPFLSGFLIALAHATDAKGEPAPSRLHPLFSGAGSPDLNMTLSQMKRFGIPCEEMAEGGFAFTAPRRKNPPDIRVGGDWSQAAMLLCANAMGSGVMVCGLERPKTGEKPLQEEARILDILRQMGLLAYETRNEIYVTSPSRAGLMPLELDCADISGLVPVLALTLSRARGRSTLKGVGWHDKRNPERQRAAREWLIRLGAKVSLSQDLDTLTVEGNAEHLLRGGFTADAKGDPCIVTLLAVAALIADAPVTVMGVEALDQSWPAFLETYKALGGNLL